MEKLLGIDSMHTMGFSWENQLFGGLTVFFKKGNVLKNGSRIEALVNLAAVAIKRLLAEKSLRESEERFPPYFAQSADASSTRCRNRTRMATMRFHQTTGCGDRITGYSCEEISWPCKRWGKLVLAEDHPSRFRKIRHWHHSRQQRHLRSCACEIGIRNHIRLGAIVR